MIFMYPYIAVLAATVSERNRPDHVKCVRLIAAACQ
jgi:hypothetical protein